MVDLWDYAAQPTITFDRLTVEFLGSLYLHPFTHTSFPPVICTCPDVICTHTPCPGGICTNTSGQDNSDRRISFVLTNNIFTRTKTEMRDMFGWQSTDCLPTSPRHPKYYKHKFWETLKTIPQYDPHTTYATQTHNPSIRMTFKIMTTTFFAWDLSVDLVYEEDLYYIFLMVHGHWNPRSFTPPDNMAWLLDYLIRLKERWYPNSGNTTRERLGIDGIVSNIEMHVNSSTKFIRKLSPKSTPLKLVAIQHINYFEYGSYDGKVRWLVN